MQHAIRRAFACAFVLSGTCNFSSAQTAADPGDVVVVTAQRYAQQIKDAIPHTTVITQEEIRDSQAVDAATLLRQQAGVEFDQTGGIGRQGSLRLRGAESSQTLVLIDGVRMNSGHYGAAQLDQVMLDEIDHIEIVRGNVSSLYGSGAMGGVVQIFTKRGRGAPMPHASVAYGSDDTRKLSAGFSGEIGDTSFNASLSDFRTDGFSSQDPQFLPGVNPDDDGYKNFSASASAAHYFNEGNKAGFSYFETKGKLQYDNRFATSADIQKGDTDLSALNFYSHNQLTERWESRLSYSRGTERYEDFANGVSTYFAKTTSDTWGWDNNIALTAAHALKTGYEHMQQKVSPDIYVNDQRHVDAGFAGYRGRIGDHQLEASGRVEDYSDFGNESTYNLGYGYFVGRGWKLTAAQSRGFRAPTFGELFSPPAWGGNPNLKPETSFTQELGVQYSRGVHYLRIVAFKTDYEDLIAADAFFVYQNIKSARVEGVETSYTGRVADFDLRVAFTVQNPHNEQADERLPRRANHFGSVNLSRSYGPWLLGGAMVASGNRYEDVSNTISMPGYAVFDLYGAYAIAKDWRLGARLDNLFDRDYELASGYNTQGRAALVTLSYQPKR